MRFMQLIFIDLPIFIIIFFYSKHGKGNRTFHERGISNHCIKIHVYVPIFITLQSLNKVIDNEMNQSLNTR